MKVGKYLILQKRKVFVMREDIKQVIMENEEFFRGRFDVAETSKGRLYFVEYAKENDAYMSFSGFETANQLEELIELIRTGRLYPE
ncbi:MAG: hypothetical protein K2P39_03245 [Lachnospiraceae bacterium]|nr:hypothetical protein [Lachnospiraceae bacterium]